MDLTKGVFASNFEGLLKSLELADKDELRVACSSRLPARADYFKEGGMKKPFVFKFKGGIGDRVRV